MYEILSFLAAEVFSFFRRSEAKKTRSAKGVLRGAFLITFFSASSVWAGDDVLGSETSSRMGGEIDAEVYHQDEVERELSLGETPSISEARAAFVDGLSLMDASRWGEAAERFSYAARGKKTPGLLYYVGYSHERAGQLVEALEAYDSAILLLRTMPASDVEALIPEARNRVMAIVPQVRLRGLQDGARLIVDGVEREPSERLSLNPGRHEILVTRAGFEDFSLFLVSVVSTTEIIQIELEALPAQEVKAPSPEKEKAAEKGSDLQRGVFWGSVGLGAVGIGVGAAGAILMSQAAVSVDRLGTEIDEISGGSSSACLDPAGELGVKCEELSAASRKNSTGTALLVGGAVGAVLGTAGALTSHYFWPESFVQVQVTLSEERSFFQLSGSF